MIYQVKVTLRNAKPPIWRRILVSPTIHLGQLHAIIQIAMGWEGYHLHQFIAGRSFYGPREDEFGSRLNWDMEDETQYKLSRFLKKEKDSLQYEYDFGDGWEHKIVLEKKLPDDGSVTGATCIKGKRACPPEDCGGIWGYQNLLEIRQDPSHPEYEEMLEWLGEDFDPEAFELQAVNLKLVQYHN